MALKSTTNILKNLRSCMKDVTYVTEPLQAYIIPTNDAHQVSKSNFIIIMFEKNIYKTMCNLRALLKVLHTFFSNTYQKIFLNYIRFIYSLMDGLIILNLRMSKI